MTTKTDKIRSRLFVWGWKNWNHKWRTILLLPVFYVVGYVIGLFGGASIFPSVVPNELAFALFGCVAILIGSAVLALID